MQEEYKYRMLVDDFLFILLNNPGKRVVFCREGQSSELYYISLLPKNFGFLFRSVCQDKEEQSVTYESVCFETESVIQDVPVEEYVRILPGGKGFDGMADVNFVVDQETLAYLHPKVRISEETLFFGIKEPDKVLTRQLFGV